MIDWTFAWLNQFRQLRARFGERAEFQEASGCDVLRLQFASSYDAFVRVEKLRSQQRIEQGCKNLGKTRRKVLLLAKIDSYVAANWPREFVSLANLDLSEADS